MVAIRSAILPDRHAVLAPVQSERPARQAFAGIPFALPVMQQAAGREARAQFADEIVGEAALGRTDRGDIPFRRFQIVDRDKGRLAAHGQANVASPKIGIDLFAERVEPRPGLVGKRPGDPRRFADPLDVHLEAEFDFGKSDRARDRRRRAIMRRGGDGDVPLAGQHARGDVEPDPSRARQIHFGPGVQIGKIVLDLARPFDRIDVGTQLDEIARHETGGEPEVAQRSGSTASAESRQDPAPDASVASGVWMPGSIRMM